MNPTMWEGIKYTFKSDIAPVIVLKAIKEYMLSKGQEEVFSRNVTVWIQFTL